MMVTPSRLSRRDFKNALWFLMGIGSLWFLRYAEARWMPELTFRFIWLNLLIMLAAFAVALIAGGGLLLRPFVIAPRDLRWSQVLLRLACAVGIGAMVKWQFSWPNPASVGDWHRLQAQGNPEDFRAFSKWLLQQAAEKPAMRDLGEREVYELLTSPEGTKFAAIAQIWEYPNYVEVEEGSDPSAVTIKSGGGFGHWGVLVRFDSLPVEDDLNSEVWKWGEGVYFYREKQTPVEGKL